MLYYFRYSRGIKSIYKVIEQLQKIPYDEVKLIPIEERAIKCCIEIEKYKEKKKEIELKKKNDLEEKQKKEEMSKLKKKEKEQKKEDPGVFCSFTNNLRLIYS